MATLEQELIEQVRKLDESGQRQVFSFVQGLTKKDEPCPSIAEALKQAEAFQDALQSKYGADHYFNSQQLLDELREESSEWPRPWISTQASGAINLARMLVIVRDVMAG